jgi:hypothetical protein
VAASRVVESERKDINYKRAILSAAAERGSGLITAHYSFQAIIFHPAKLSLASISRTGINMHVNFCQSDSTNREDYYCARMSGKLHVFALNTFISYSGILFDLDKVTYIKIY